MTVKANKTAVIGMTLFTTNAAIAKETARIKSVGTTYQVDLHVLACSVLQHLGKNGNIGVVTQFIEAVPDVVRVNALKDWFEAFAKLTFIGTDGKVMKTPAYVKAKPQRLGEAMEKPFWKFKANEGAPYKPLVMIDYLADQIKKLEKDAKETKSKVSPLVAAMKLEQSRLAAVH